MTKVSVKSQWILISSMLYASSIQAVFAHATATLADHHISLAATSSQTINFTSQNDVSTELIPQEQKIPQIDSLENLFPLEDQTKVIHNEMKKLEQRIIDDTPQTNLDEMQQAASVLEHTVWQSNQIRVYQHTQYNAQTATDKFKQGAVQQIGLEDLSLSVGYGMEYYFNSTHAIGYEYVSNFPYDRGQSIRLFWVRLF